MNKGTILMYQKRGGGVSCFNLNMLENQNSWEQFQRLDKEYGHTDDLIDALDNGLVVELLVTV